MLLACLAACGRFDFDGLAPPPDIRTEDADLTGDAVSIDAAPRACDAIPQCTNRKVFSVCGSRCVAACGETRTQADAEAFCVAWGGHLMSLHSEEERSCLLDLFPHDAWLGYVQLPGQSTSAAEWHWLDGSDPTFTYWNPGEPNDGDGVEDSHEQCAHTYVSQHWNDRPCEGTVGGYVCAREAPL